MKTPILFLDIDGVLNSTDWRIRRDQHVPKEWRTRQIWDFDPVAVLRLNTIFEHAPDAKIVISSTWRLLHSLSELSGFLKEAGFTHSDRIIGRTPDGRTRECGPLWRACERGDEIEMWRDANGHTGPFAVLDDDGDMDAVIDHLVQTSSATGLLGEHVNEVLELFECTT